MIEYIYTSDFKLDNEVKYTEWLTKAIDIFGFELGDLTYTFMSDADLLKLNIEYLDHDTYTDIISFDYTIGDIISGDIMISIDRVRENAASLGLLFHVELLRVMAHGILHYMGYRDKTESEKNEMRSQEDIFINLF